MDAPPRRWPRGVGLLLSIVLGLFLALLALVPVMLGGGRVTEGPYCSKWGIGDDFDLKHRETGLVYDSGAWEGFPPGRDCQVYAVEDGTGAGGRVSWTSSQSSDLLNRPHRLLAEGSYPERRHYAWVLLALLLPPMLWICAQLIRRPPPAAA